MDIVEERVIGPSMGQDNIEKGFKAVLLGLALVLRVRRRSTTSCSAWSPTSRCSSTW